MKVQVQVAELIDFGPELQIAKKLVDECLNEWSADSRPEIQALVSDAFDTDKEGKINRAKIFMLLRHSIEDERWMRAMDAIRDAMRVTGSKEYVRFYTREKTGRPVAGRHHRSGQGLREREMSNQLLYNCEAQICGLFPIHAIGDAESPPEWVETFVDAQEFEAFAEQFPELQALIDDNSLSSRQMAAEVADDGC